MRSTRLFEDFKIGDDELDQALFIKEPGNPPLHSQDVSSLLPFDLVQTNIPYPSDFSEDDIRKREDLLKTLVEMIGGIYDYDLGLFDNTAPKYTHYTLLPVGFHNSLRPPARTYPNPGQKRL